MDAAWGRGESSSRPSCVPWHCNEMTVQSLCNASTPPCQKRTHPRTHFMHRHYKDMHLKALWRVIAVESYGVSECVFATKVECVGKPGWVASCATNPRNYL